MKSKEKLLLVVLMALVLISINNYFSSEIHIIHEFQVKDKVIKSGKYNITGYYGLAPELTEIKFQLKDNYGFIYEAQPKEKIKASISDIWDRIKVNQTYYLIFKKNKFPWNLIRKYNIIEIHGY